MGSGRGGLTTAKRVLVTIFFMCTMLISLLASSGPLFISVADVTVLLLCNMAACSTCIFSVADWKSYSFDSSLIDIPLLSLLRSFIVICCYNMCSSPMSYTPYFGITLLFGAISTIFLTVKASVFRLEASAAFTVHNHIWPLSILLSLGFACAHIIMAHRARSQARRKLLFRWEDEEAVIVGKEHPRSSPPRNISKISRILEGKHHHRRRDSYLPASLLADNDSLFMTCKDILVHYKLIEGDQNRKYRAQNSIRVSAAASSGMDSIYTPLLSISVNKTDFPVENALNGWPAIAQEILGGDFVEVNCSTESPKAAAVSERKGIVLIHGFGGGVFSWRHIMGPLARQTKSTVVAFDRPGWGLTARPSRNEWEKKGSPNPYELQSQVELLFSFCEGVGLSSVVLVGHDDGGLLALMAAATASKSQSSTAKVSIKGVVLVGVSLSREVVPSFARVLLHTSLGRQMLRPLLRSEIGQVANRRAWHDASKLTSEILDLYKAPLRVEGWDEALAEVTKTSASGILQSGRAAELLQTVGNLPALLVAGLQDVFVPLKSAQSLATKLPQSKLVAIPGCGHLPPEECPGALLDAMLPFISTLFESR